MEREKGSYVFNLSVVLVIFAQMFMRNGGQLNGYPVISI